MINYFMTSHFLSYIEEMNQEYLNFTNSEIQSVAIGTYSDANFLFKCFSPMRNLVTLSPKKNKVIIDSLNYEIDIKYIRNTKSSNGTYSNSYPWASLLESFSWLSEEIKLGNKNKRMFVIGWFNTSKSLSEIIQLGEPSGSKPKINYEKLAYFPFLNSTSANTKNIFTQYSDAFNQLNIKIKGYSEENINCIFLGKKEDKFHIAIYY